MMLKELINLIYPKDYLQPRFAAVVGAVAAVGGAAIAADGAKQSGKAIQRGAEASNELQKYMFEQSRTDQLPWMNRGNEAGNRLQYLLGLNTSPTGNGFTPRDRDQIRADLQGQYTRFGDSYTSSLSPYEEYMRQQSMYAGEYDAANKFQPHKTQATYIDTQALEAAIDAEMARDQERLQKERQQLQSDPQFGSLLRTFSKEDLDKDVVYQNGLQFGLDEGRKAVNNQLAASGSMLSGAALKALTRYGNDYATTKTADAYNRFNNNQSQIYNRLAGISGTGQTTSNQIADQSMKVGASMGENKLMGGIARGSSYQGVNNALQNGISGVYGAGKKAGWWGGSTGSGTITNSDGSTNYAANGWWDLNSGDWQ